MGREALVAGNAQGAIDSCEAALAIQPGSIGVTLDLAEASRKQGMQGKALRYYRIAIERDPQNLEAIAGEGATLVAGGKRPDGFAKGFYYEPTLFDNVDNASRLAQEEVFGPIGAVIGFDSDEEAIAIANHSDFGLSGGIYAGDAGLAYQMALQLRTGGVSINGGAGTMQSAAPFGGIKRSGYGREYGVEGLNEFTYMKTISLRSLAAEARSQQQSYTRDFSQYDEEAIAAVDRFRKDRKMDYQGDAPGLVDARLIDALKAAYLEKNRCSGSATKSARHRSDFQQSVSGDQDDAAAEHSVADTRQHGPG